MFVNICIIFCRRTKKPLSLWCSVIWKAVFPSTCNFFVLRLTLNVCKDTNIFALKQIMSVSLTDFSQNALILFIINV